MSSDLIKKDVNYIGRDFANLRKNLINHVKNYFPDNYKDFSDSSAGSLLIDLASYVGDVLSFYTDEQFKELYIDTAKQRKNVINLANMFSYKIKPKVSATTDLDMYVVVPSSGSNNNKIPDPYYCPIISQGAKAKSNTSPSIIFETMYDINFGISSSFDDVREEIIFETDVNDIPTKFLLKKKVQIVGSETTSFSQVVGDVQKYLKIQLPSDEVTEIISVVDSDNNKWYEVDSLAQDTIFIEQQNILSNDPELVAYSGSSPYLLKLKKVPKRYEVKVDENNLTYLLFGSGVYSSNDEEVIPNPLNVGSPNPIGDNRYDASIDPENFLKTKTFGEAPHGTTLTINYRAGGGLETNVGANTIKQIENATFTFPVNTNILDQSKISDIKNSISCNNPSPATGGYNLEPIDVIKKNAISNLKSQKRCVTKEDYIVRAYSLPSKFGNVAKIYIEKDDATRDYDTDDIKNAEGLPILKPKDPLALNMYVLAYNSSKQLTNASLALKRNLKTYISQYRIITDTINIVDGTIVNFQVFFEVISHTKENKNVVLMRCIDKLKEYFNIDKWNFNQPIVISEVYNELYKVEGVQSIPKIDFVCKNGSGYSNNYLDMKGLTDKGIIYPSRKVMIYELKIPNSDLIGSCIG